MKNIIITIAFGFLVGLILGLYFSFSEYTGKMKTDNAYEIQHMTDYRYYDTN